MKKVLVITSLIVLALSIAVAAAAPAYKDGKYIGFAPGGGKGDYMVEVEILFGKIADVDIIIPYKPADYKSQPSLDLFRSYPITVEANQKADIDVVAGATHSSHSYVEATQMALDIAAGTYKGKAFYGYAPNFAHGHAVVKITVDNKKVTDFEFVTWKYDNDGFLMKAKDANYKHKVAVEYFNNFPKMAIKAQADISKIDVVAGATHSYDEWTYAYKSALKQAGLLQ